MQDELCRIPNPSLSSVHDRNSPMAIVMRITTTSASIWMRPKAEIDAMTWRTITTSAEAALMTEKVRQSIETLCQAAEGSLFWGEPLWKALFDRVIPAAHKAGFTLSPLKPYSAHSTAPAPAPVGWRFSCPTNPRHDRVLSLFPRKASYLELLLCLAAFSAHSQETEAQNAASSELLSFLGTVNPTGLSERAQALLEDLQAELQASTRPASR